MYVFLFAEEKRYPRISLHCGKVYWIGDAFNLSLSANLLPRSEEPYFQIIIFNKTNNKDFYKDIPYNNKSFAQYIRLWDANSYKFVLFEEKDKEFSFWFSEESDNEKFITLAKKYVSEFKHIPYIDI